MKTVFIVLFFMSLWNPPARAGSLVLQTKDFGAIEFSDEAHALFQKQMRARRAAGFLLTNRSCEPSRNDLVSNNAVHYHYACVFEIKGKSVIIYSADRSIGTETKNAVRFRIGLLDDLAFSEVRAKSDYQIMVKQHPSMNDSALDPSNTPPLSGWYRLTLVDIQDPENMAIAKVKFAQFDQTMNELEQSMPSARH